jgi:hypothetical protein
MENLLNITAPRTETFPVFLMFRFTSTPELSENQLITAYFALKPLRRKGCGAQDFSRAIASFTQTAGCPANAPFWQTPRAGAFPQSAGAFPQTAGAFPQTAGAFPQTAGAFPQSAGASTRTAGAFPQTAWAFPQSAGAFPQTAGAFPQTAGAFPRIVRRFTNRPKQPKQQSYDHRL